MVPRPAHLLTAKDGALRCLAAPGRKVPTLLDIAYDRLRYLIGSVDSMVARLYAVEVATSALPAWEAVCPWDQLPEVALVIAGRFAERKATDEERRLTGRLIALACGRMEPASTFIGSVEAKNKAWAACNAAGFTLWKAPRTMLDQTIWWTRQAVDPEGDILAHYSTHVAGLERAKQTYKLTR